MKAMKRCIAVVLSLLIFTTSVNISKAAGAYDNENYIWKADEAEIVAGYYGLDEEEVDILTNDAVNGGYEYVLLAPYANGTQGKKDLVVIDYLEKRIYAKALYTEGLSWLPTKAVLSTEGEVIEEITLKTGACYYKEEEYDASEAFIYNGSSYSVEVTYQLDVSVTLEEQNRVLQIPAILTQTAINLEKNLEGVYSDLKSLGDMMPALNRLLTFEFQTVESVTSGNAALVSEAKTEPALDPKEDADVIHAIETLYQEYTDNKGLILCHISEEYRNLGGKNILSFTFENGARILEESTALYECISILKDSKRLRSVWSDLYTEDPKLYSSLRDLQKVLRNLAGTGSNELKELQKEENWSILKEDVKTQIFAESYTEEDFKVLEVAVYALRNHKTKEYSVTSDRLTASKMGIRCDITIYDISVSMNAAAASGEMEDSEVYQLESYGTVIRLLKGATEEEIQQAIAETGIETMSLEAWNSLNSEYQINAVNYNRKETGIPRKLTGNVECVISYSPKFYKVKTNFRGSTKLPYGFQFQLPVSENPEISYDYVIETENGTKISYDEGVYYKVTQPVKITRTQGSDKVQYRLYDLLIKDTQYALSPESTQILSNTAVKSPTLKIRMPDSRCVSDLISEEGVYGIEAQDYYAGILGMTWKPESVYLMNNDTLLAQIPFEGNVANWRDTGFTHVEVVYSLKINKVSSGILNRSLDEAEVLYALNLPHQLVTHTVKQNQLLYTGEDISAKILYDEIQAVSNMINSNNLDLLAGLMETDEEKDAMMRLQGSEDEKIKGQNGQTLGYGAWNTTKNELALYTYLKACAATADAEGKWSLATYYQGLNMQVANQAAIVADCLEVIIAAPKLLRLVSNFSSLQESVDRINEMLPKLRLLAESIEEPHEAIDIEDGNYKELIGLLLQLEGKTTSVDSSNGIYAYATVRRNANNSGSLTVSVQVGSMPAQTKAFSFVMEGESHILTEEEAALIAGYVTELESQCGITEEEKAYYEISTTAIPKAGEAVRQNDVVSITYLPRTYTVTIKGVSASEYKATFKYKGDYVIELPSFSKNSGADRYYRYLIEEGKSIDVLNGSFGYYTFTEEELTTKFATGHYELLGRQEIVVRDENQSSDEGENPPSQEDQSQEDQSQEENSPSQEDQATEDSQPMQEEQSTVQPQPQEPMQPSVEATKKEAVDYAELEKILMDVNLVLNTEEGRKVLQDLINIINEENVGPDDRNRETPDQTTPDQETQDERQNGPDHGNGENLSSDESKETEERNQSQLWKLLLVGTGILFLIFNTVVIFLWRKGKKKAKDYNGAPMVEYDINDDDE